MTDRAEVQRELDRVVDRLSTMPLGKTQGSADDCRRTAQLIVDRTHGVPDAVVVPEVGASALGAQIAVVGRDFLDAPNAPADRSLSDVLHALVELRRSLP